VRSFGLLLRWEAALHELEAFRQIPADRLQATLDGLAAATMRRLAAPAFEPLVAPRPDRIGAAGWDAAPTLFPFLVRGAHGVLSAAQTQALYQDLSGSGVHLGQPVPVGRRDGRPVSALRLAISARQLVEASGRPGGTDALAGRIADTLDLVAARAAVVG
jgi:hypothetical protein